jgi:hypothetical protein
MTLADFNFRGKYARYVKFLTEDLKPEGGGSKFSIFPRMIDVYTMGALMGYLHNKTGSYDSGEESEGDKDLVATIKENTFLKDQARFKLLCQMVLLNENIRGLSVQKRINNAFKDDTTDKKTSEENMEIINSYVLGGITYLYNKFEKVRTKEDVAMKMHDMIEDFIVDRNISFDLPNGSEYE